jgi:alpha-ketoglutarate-dependent taurine dioxygenase
MRQPGGLTVTRSPAVIGAEIGGVDLGTRLTTYLHDELRRLLGCHRVLFFRDQHISTDQFIALAEAFGPILNFRSVVPADPEHPGVHNVDGSTVGWHIDASGMREPPVAALLQAVEIPPSRGDTIWADGVAAYNGLPGELKKRLEGRCATHTAPQNHPVVAHPLTPVHPDTRERYLFINFAPWVDTRILGMSNADSRAVVTELRNHYLRAEYQVRFRWSPAAIVMWDNRVLQHTGVRDYPEGVRRRLKRICIGRFR